MNDIKNEMKERARLTRVLVNALSHDADYIYADVENCDLLCLNESIRETKRTIQNLLDNVTELEYLLYLLKREETRK